MGRSPDSRHSRCPSPRWTLAILLTAAVLLPALRLTPETVVADDAVHWALSAGGRNNVPIPLAPAWQGLGRLVWMAAPAGTAPRILATLAAIAWTLTAVFAGLLFLDLPQNRFPWQRKRWMNRHLRYWWPAVTVGILVGWSPGGLLRGMSPEPYSLGTLLVVFSVWLMARAYRVAQETLDKPGARPDFVFSGGTLVVLGVCLGAAVTFGGLVSFCAIAAGFALFGVDALLFRSPRRLAILAGCGVVGPALLAAQAWALSHGDNPLLGAPPTFAGAARSLVGALGRSARLQGPAMVMTLMLLGLATLAMIPILVRIRRARESGIAVRNTVLSVLLAGGAAAAAALIYQPLVSDPKGVPVPFPQLTPDAAPLLVCGALALVWIACAGVILPLGVPVARAEAAGFRLRAGPVRAGAVAVLVVLPIALLAWRTSSSVRELRRIGAEYAAFERALRASAPDVGVGAAVVAGDGSALDRRARLAIDRGPQPVGWIHVPALRKRGGGGDPTFARKRLRKAADTGLYLLHADLAAPAVGAVPIPTGLIHRIDGEPPTEPAVIAAEADRFADEHLPEAGSAAMPPAIRARWSRFCTEAALLAAQTGDLRAAIEWTDRAIEFQPINVVAFGNLAIFRARLAAADPDPQANANEAYLADIEVARQRSEELRRIMGGRPGYLALHRSFGDLATPVWFIAAAIDSARPRTGDGAADIERAACFATRGVAVFPESYRLGLLAGGLRLLLEPSRLDAEIDAIKAAFPDEPTVDFGTAIWCWIAGETDRADSLLQRFADAHEEIPAPALILSRIRSETGDLQGALAALEEAVGRGTPATGTARREAELMLAMGDADRAEERVRTALDETPDNGLLLVALARIQLTRDLRPEALASFDAAYRVDPNIPGLRVERLLLRATVEPESAEAEHEAKMLASDPDHGWAGHLALGRIAQARGRLADAEENYRQSIERRETPMALNNLALVLIERDRGGGASEAFDLARAAIEELPDNPGVQDTLGWTALHAGDFDTARAALDAAWDAVRDDDSFPAADRAAVRLHRAVLALESGRPDEARDLAADIDPTVLPREDRDDYDRLLRRLDDAG